MFIEHRQESWSTGQLSDLISVKYGKDHKKLADGNYPVYGSGGIMRYVEKPLYTGESVLFPRKGTLNNIRTQHLGIEHGVYRPERFIDIHDIVESSFTGN